MDLVNEGKYHDVQWTLRDTNGNPYVPASLKYSIWCETTKQSVLGETVVAVTASEGTIRVPGTLNAILKDANKKELKTMTLFFDYDTDDQVTEVSQWFVKNLSAV